MNRKNDESVHLCCQETGTLYFLHFGIMCNTEKDTNKLINQINPINLSCFEAEFALSRFMAKLLLMNFHNPSLVLTKCFNRFLLQNLSCIGVMKQQEHGGQSWGSLGVCRKI